MLDLVSRRVLDVRPRMAMLDGEAAANEYAMCEPRPEPPPVIRMFFPLAELRMEAEREG